MAGSWPGGQYETREQALEVLLVTSRIAPLSHMWAVLEAQAACTHHDVGATHALRQSLVDLAAIVELLADELPVPTCSRHGSAAQVANSGKSD